MKSRTIYSLFVLLVLAMTTTVYAAQRNLIGNWGITFKGYYGNEQVGTTYGEKKATFHITKQTGQSFAGTVEIESSTESFCLTGNIKNDKIVMIIGGNTFIRGNVYDTANGPKMNLIMETQQMSHDDTQGVLYGTASKK